MTLIPNDYQRGINKAYKSYKIEINALKEENKKLKEQLRLHIVSQQSEMLKAYESMLLNAGDLTQEIKNKDRKNFIEAFNLL